MTHLLSCTHHSSHKQQMNAFLNGAHNGWIICVCFCFLIFKANRSKTFFYRVCRRYIKFIHMFVTYTSKTGYIYILFGKMKCRSDHLTEKNLSFNIFFPFLYYSPIDLMVRSPSHIVFHLESSRRFDYGFSFI